jgi:hypothetical protein
MRTGRPTTSVWIWRISASRAIRSMASPLLWSMVSTGCARMPKSSVAATPIRASP